MKKQFVCEECGKAFERYVYSYNQPRFCSRPCQTQWMKREVFPKHKAPWLRELNQQPGRNAQISKETSEKRRLAQIASKPAQPKTYLKDHGKHAHRRIASEIMGVALSPDVIVHHIDGDCHNNAPENLLITTAEEHGRIHHPKGIDPRKQNVDTSEDTPVETPDRGL